MNDETRGLYEAHADWEAANPAEAARRNAALHESAVASQRRLVAQTTALLAVKAKELEAAERRGRRGRVAALRLEVADLEREHRWLTMAPAELDALSDEEFDALCWGPLRP